MRGRQKSNFRSPFALGFEHGAEAVEDASVVEMDARVPEYRVGYVVGRCYSEAVRQTSLLAGVVVAGELGAKFGVDKSALVAALRLSHDHELVIDEKYADDDSADRRK
ncbi:hypothetical protein PQQ73_08460 [Paraburkholderia strydomiana]|uniref:Uncharacterized protein n=1 Tax=Paraburkholderia strydomiana TaxID=1245417 RepID=A0ABW9EE00_9BURK